MPLALLALLATQQPAPALLIIDAPAAALLSPSATGGTRAAFSPSLRASYLFESEARFRLGVSASLFISLEDTGTNRIRASEWLVGSELSGMAGWGFGDPAKILFVPFISTAGLIGFGAATRQLDSLTQERAVGRGALLLGGGVLLKLWWISFRLDAAAGTLGLEPGGRLQAALGWAF